MATPAAKANTVAVYRNMLRMVKGMTPEKKRVDTLQTLKAQWRDHAHEEDPAAVQALLAKANSSLGYLKMISPKVFRTPVPDKTVDSDSSGERGGETQTTRQSGRTRIVFGSGGEKKTYKVESNWTGANMDPDQVARHYNQLKRAGFTDNRSVTGPQF